MPRVEPIKKNSFERIGAWLFAKTRTVGGMCAFYGRTMGRIFRRWPRGKLITDQMMQTSVRGFFAAGDVRAGATAQAASAAGEGAAVALMMRDYLRTVA